MKKGLSGEGLTMTPPNEMIQSNIFQMAGNQIKSKFSGGKHCEPRRF
jgi:hypothetical protein